MKSIARISLGFPVGFLGAHTCWEETGLASSQVFAEVPGIAEFVVQFDQFDLITRHHTKFIVAATTKIV